MHRIRIHRGGITITIYILNFVAINDPESTDIFYDTLLLTRPLTEEEKKTLCSMEMTLLDEGYGYETITDHIHGYLDEKGIVDNKTKLACQDFYLGCNMIR